MAKSNDPIITIENAKLFVYDTFRALGVSQKAAEISADVIIDADIRGHYSHGMNILYKLVMDLEKGMIDHKASPNVLKETVCTAWVDGCNALGPLVADFCMNLAIKKAKEIGFGLVVAKNSSNLGIAGYYSEYALQKNCIGLAFTNAGAMMVPSGAKVRALGPNPISMAAPAQQDDYFSLDMSTTTVSDGKIDIYRKNRQDLEKGWAYNSDGLIETDSEVAARLLMLVPLGGLKYTAGYKGSGLSMMVDILCGVLSGSAYGPNLKMWNEDKPMISNVGHCFMAINLDNFAPYFTDRLTDSLVTYRKNEPIDAMKLPLVPGDLSKQNRKKVAETKGIRYSQQQINICQLIASKFKITPLQCSSHL